MLERAETRAVDRNCSRGGLGASKHEGRLTSSRFEIIRGLRLIVTTRYKSSYMATLSAQPVHNQILLWMQEL